MSSLPPPVAALKARLLCRIRPGLTERFAVQKSEVVLGREPGLAVTVPLDGVSRRHARITFDGKSYSIENLSPAGTFLNGSLVVRERLAHLDVITLGKRVDLLFLLRAEEESTATIEGIVRAALVTEGADAVPYEIVPGEILLGRSSANNVVVEASGAVSKVHARIERTPQQLVLRDLGSSNGTYVNGERVMTALLRDGDVLGLANVITYRVVIQRGAVLAAIAAGTSTPEGAAAEAERAEFSPEWKTRYDWDSGEIKAIAALQAQLIAEDEARKQAKVKKEGATEKGPVVAPPKTAGAKPAAAKPAAPKPVAPKPVAPEPAVPKPAGPVTTQPAAVATVAAPPAAPVAPPVRDDASAAKAAADALAAQGKAPIVPVPVSPPAPAVAASPPPPAVAVPPRAPSGADAPVAELCLSGPTGDLVVKEPGEYSLGRAKDAPLRVDNPTVSRRHALIVLSPERQAFVDDGGGANGTRLNGVMVAKRSRLRDGDKVAIGEVELVVRLKTV